MSHISVEPLPAPFIPILDKFLAVNCLLGLLVGLPGNALALKYFARFSRSSLSTRLYIAICTVDLVTCFAHLPVMVSLLQDRRPLLFSSLAFCIGWRVLFRALQLLAIFLVMLLSTSRAVAIVTPFHAPKEGAVLGSFFFYIAFLGLQNGALRYKQSHQYTSWDAYCFEDLGPDEVYGMIDDYLYVVEIGVPSLVIFISFIVSVYKLRMSGLTAVPTQNTKNSASMTIVVVTAVFLACNLPQFTNMTLWNLDHANYAQHTGPVYGSHFMMYYAWNISAIQMVVLNASLSPFIYFCRIAEFRVWVWDGCERNPVTVSVKSWIARSKNSRANSVASDLPYSPDKNSRVVKNTCL